MMGKQTDVNNTQITAGQIAKLLFLFSLGTAVLTIPTLVTILAKQDAWLVMLLIIPIHYGVLLIYLGLAKRFPTITFADYVEKITGKWIGKVILVMFLIYFITLAALVLHNISDFLNLSVLPNTPPWFISISFMVVVLYGVFLGIETLARLGDVMSAAIVVVIFIVVIALLNKFNIHHMEPILYNGWSTVFRGMHLLMGFPIAECVFITMILPMVKTDERKQLPKKLLWAVITVGIVGFTLVLLLQGVLGVYETSRSRFAIFDMAKNINIEEILVRVEVLVAVIWIGSSFMKMAIVLYVICLLTSHLFKLSTYRPVIIPYIMIIVPLCMTMYRNVEHMRQFSINTWSTYSVIQGIVIPLILLILATLFRKRETKHEQQSKAGQNDDNQTNDIEDDDPLSVSTNN
ncbi:endospore germination permease [Paenibacillus yanchengensis]|uniref:Endospore germination permease n=1 Tax=Paenibacillus yanchengensis TaxID=2035833 RepID=A0ABW4YMW8_9BACL